MFFINFISVISIVSNVFAGHVVTDDFILVQRENTVHLNSHFMSEHNINPLATFDDFKIFTIDGNDYAKYFNTLRSFFHVEYNQVIKLNHKSVDTETGSDDQFVFKNNNKPIPWHLDRIDKLGGSDMLDGTYRYNASGLCHTNPNVEVDVYVVDTGIDINHKQFSGRATWVANFADDDDTDCQNHGTHCAGIIGSDDYGVCKDANLHAIKVLDCSGSGTLAGVIKGVEHAYNIHNKKVNAATSAGNGKIVKSVISMSLGGGFSRIINRAVENCLKKSDSFYVVVAAGNEDSDACKTSPASAEGVLTVMASDIEDNRAYFSNWGKCADIYAPGVNVLSTIPNDKTAIYSGTSMATPATAGVLVHYLHMHPTLNMQEIKNKMLSDSNKNLIKNNKRNTKNTLVYLDHPSA